MRLPLGVKTAPCSCCVCPCSFCSLPVLNSKTRSMVSMQPARTNLLSGENGAAGADPAGWGRGSRKAAVAAVEVADVPAALRRCGGNGVLAHLLAGLHLPDAQVVVAEDAAANGPLAVGRERHGPNSTRV